MAERKIDGSTVILMIDPAAGTDWQLPICLTTNGLAATTAANNSTTKCGNISTPGDQAVTISLDGAVFLNPDAGHIDISSLFSLWQDQTEFSWRMGPLNPVANDVIRTGNGYFSAYNESYPTGVATFSGTIQVSNDIVQTLHGAS
jgi:hypothetical protein